VKEATLRVYPEGDAKATNEFNALLAPDIEFTQDLRSRRPTASGGRSRSGARGDPALPERSARGRSALAHVRIPVL